MTVLLHGVGTWRPDEASVAAFAEGRPDDAVVRPKGALMPRGVNRRATPLARMAAEALAAACEDAGVDPAGVGWVLGTVGGELPVTFEGLAMMREDPPTSSPLRFRNSVHNAALGHLGIALGNTGYASALSAQAERLLPMVVLEGWARVRDVGGHVAVIAVDDVVPDRPAVPLATCLVLGAPGTEGKARARLHDLGRAAGVVDPVEPGLAGGPMGPAWAAVATLAATTAPRRVALGPALPGESPWSVQVTPGRGP